MTADVLLLNATYEPLRIISVRRAIRLLTRGVAEAVDGVAAQLHTPTTVVEVPSVLRLHCYVSVPRRRAKWSRQAILNRDRYTCVYCGIQAGDRRRGRLVTRTCFTIDHLIPRSRGGANTWGNTACACRWCNSRKANRTPHEAGMRLRWEPKLPRVNYLVASGEVPVEWKAYLRTSVS
jgi:5-methylcytosine-specific restriction endonuclease McrA